MITLDHAGVVGLDLLALHTQYEALGFTLTPLAEQSYGGPEEMVFSAWRADRCAMLREGYIELVGEWDGVWPFGASSGLDKMMARHVGMHILALGIDDEVAAVTERLRRAGLGVPRVGHCEHFKLPVDKDYSWGLRTLFHWLSLPDMPEGDIYLMRHWKPEAIWHERVRGPERYVPHTRETRAERYLVHANRAVALETMVLAVANPAESAARLSKLAGRPVAPDPAGGFVLSLSRGSVRVLGAESMDAVLPGVTAPALPFMAGMVVRTDDRAMAARRLAPLRAVPGGWMAGPEMAGGAAVVFC